MIGFQQFRGRRAATLDNDQLRVTVLVEGGHIAELFDRAAAVSPLWIPPWQSIEPSAFAGSVDGDVYGRGADGRLLAGIMGHNLCLDVFGGPSPEEAEAGMTAHGDASVVEYDIRGDGEALLMRASLPLAQIDVERRIELQERSVAIRERVMSRCAFDRPIGWTQHVTLGPPFLEPGATEFRVSAMRSKVFEAPFGADDYLAVGAPFDWPHAPRLDGGTADLRLFPGGARSSAYTAHLMDATAETAYFVAFAPAWRLAFGYVWQRSDFPWMGIWEENHSRTASPWCGATLTRAMEFGVSPFPETRRAMVERGRLFDTPTFRWLPANGTLEATYWIVLQTQATIPERISPPNHGAPS